jgi:hypothetical protein
MRLHQLQLRSMLNSPRMQDYNTGSQSKNTTLGWKRYVDMANLEAHFLQPALEFSKELSTKHAVDVVNEAERLQLIGIVTFFLALIASYVLLVNPLVSSLDNEVIHTLHESGPLRNLR